MSEHTVTENITQRDGQSSAHLECSCGLSMVVVSVRKTPMRVAREQLDAMHKNLVPENSPKPKKSKKQRPIKLTLEDDGEARKAYESEDDPHLYVDEPE